MGVAIESKHPLQRKFKFMPDKRNGLLIVNTGDGKGKSTAAFGILFRAWGRGMKPCVIQFMKAETGQ